jgi:putative Holliday junction resolvase
MDNYYRFLAIDYGRKRIGMANTDLMRIVVSTLEHIDNIDIDQSVSKVVDIVNSSNVKKIIIGCPIENVQNKAIVEEINLFVAKIKEKLSVECIIVDESFSSKRAVEKMVEVGKKKKYRASKGNVDSFAAAIILEEYLQNEN